jgi:hypothetical protein
MKQKILIVTIKSWNIKNFNLLKQKYEDFDFYLITNKKELNIDNVSKINPKFIFFPHWSWFIPESIYLNFKCIVFHASDLPFGRGGTPLQNLIIRQIYKTKISALEAIKEYDAGKIYLKEDIDISAGSAKEIFINISNIIFFKMIPRILLEDITPVDQVGEVVNFERRRPEQSDLKTLKHPDLIKIYDFIRMLDADGYPKAFLEFKKYKIEFSSVKNKNKKIIGRFEIHEK